jgi:hypothetical protein
VKKKLMGWVMHDDYRDKGNPGNEARLAYKAEDMCKYSERSGFPA